VHHAVEAARPLFESLDQTLTVVLPDVPVYLNADATRLAQIVGNLLSNASKFSEPDGHIWLIVERADEDGLPPGVTIRVRDTGLGIAAEQQSRIFDMFAQVDAPLERPGTGLGVGLALVKTLTELHAGTVDVSSAGIGQGSEFIVRLPILIESAAATPRAVPAAPAVAAQALRILVVDDNRDAADMLALFLRLGGHEAHTVHDGVAAVEATTRLQPDLVLLDICLPGVNGYEAARRIRKQHKQSGGPVLVALSGWGQDQDRRRSEEAGFDAHLVKPVDESDLCTILANVRSRK
jgi:CheY-like chemotaxis protein